MIKYNTRKFNPFLVHTFNVVFHGRWKARSPSMCYPQWWHFCALYPIRVILTSKDLKQWFALYIVVSSKPKVEEIFSALGDDISLRLFRLASIGIDPTTEFMQKTGLTRKQFYTRLQKFVKLGLVQKKQGLYTLTTLGTVVQNIQLKPLEEIVDNYWKDWLCWFVGCCKMLLKMGWHWF